MVSKTIPQILEHFFFTHNFKKISVNGPAFYVLIPQSQCVMTMEGNLDLQCRVRVAG